MRELDRLVNEEGLSGKSELIRKSLDIYMKIKKAEQEGRIVVLTQQEDLKKLPVQLLT